MIKNKFDESRIKIKPKYKPERISHFTWSHQLEPVFFYGVEIKPKKTWASLLDRVSTLVNDKPDITPHQYMDILKPYNLSCDECYSYLSDGVYPIDVEHLSSISRKTFTKEMNSGFNNMLQQTEHPWYATLPNFKLFILSRSVGYHMDYNLT
tara:strand:+ start:185 stop:640 length:456 start_codon:yes stop_codon:yes gene_type:complete